MGPWEPEEVGGTLPKVIQSGESWKLHSELISETQQKMQDLERPDPIAAHEAGQDCNGRHRLDQHTHRGLCGMLLPDHMLAYSLHSWNYHYSLMSLNSLPQGSEGMMGTSVIAQTIKH